MSKILHKTSRLNGRPRVYVLKTYLVFVTNLVLHLFLLGQLDLCDLRHALHLDPGAEHLDLVRVHRSVGDQDARVLQPLRLVLSGRLIQKET